MQRVVFERSQVTYIDHMGTDATVVNSARVSFNKKVEAISEKDEKLIRYLAKNDHWSPFAHTSIQFRVKAPIFIARQLVKHSVGGVWNEVSRRYVSDNVTFFMPHSWRQKPVNAKQGSSGDVSLTMTNDANDKLYEVCNHALAVYDEMITRGIAPEQARMILPQAMMTEWYWTGSLVYWQRVCKQRLDSHAQSEARDIAEMISSECARLFPLSWKALMNFPD